MKTAVKDTIKTITTHYIDGAFVESYGREVINIIRPTDGQVIARVTLADEEDTRRAIAAAKRAFATYGRSTKEERAQILRRLHEALRRDSTILLPRWSKNTADFVRSAHSLCNSAL